MDGELKTKILAYADKSYYAAYQKSLRDTEIKLANAKAALAVRGLSCSSAMVQEVARIEAEHIQTCVLAKTNALLDGYELSGAEIDDFIKLQASELRWQLVQSIGRNANPLPPGTPDGGMFERLLVTNTNGVLETAECEIEQRKANPKMRKPQQPVQNVYHLHGNNSRVNIDSTDQSINTVNVTSQELFVQMRQTLSESITGEEQGRILKKLEAMEQAQNTPTFGQRYAEFIAASADYVTLLTPFMPALAEMVKKALIG